MAEIPAGRPPPSEKTGRYQSLLTEIESVLGGEDNLVARMATVASMLADAFETFFWTGFYVVDAAKPDELVVGPYQGSLGCLRIAFGRGVCGTAARRASLAANGRLRGSSDTSPATRGRAARSSSRSLTRAAS